MIKRLLLYLMSLSVLLSSSCASILNSRYQKVTINTGANDASIYVNDVKAGTGSSVVTKMRRDFDPKQIKVERPGYKPEYFVHRQTKKHWLKYVSLAFIYPLFMVPLLDRGPKAFNYEKEMKVSTSRKLNNKKEGQKFMVLKNVDFDVKKEDFIVERIEYKRMKKGKSAKARDKSTMDDDIVVNNTIFSNALNSALYDLGYIDTSGKVLRSRTNTTFINAKVSKIKFTSVTNSTGSYSRSLICETTIEWQFLDAYNQVKYKRKNTVKSGEFTEYSYMSGSSNLQKAIELTVQDAITNSFYEMVESRGSKEYLASKVDSMNNAEMPVLALKSGTIVKEMKTAVEATVIIKSKSGFGSGCVVSEDGYVVTCFHVVAGEDSSLQVIFKDGDTLNAKVIRNSEFADLALLKVEKKCKYTFKLMDQPQFEVADEVFAIGTPTSMELGQTISKGIISGIRKGDNGSDLIQTDVSVNPGNSGGSLLKRDGTFIGVVSAKIFGKGVEGLGFCTPSSVVIKELRIQTN